MYSYREYPIRCESCGEQLACYAEEYENLVESFSSQGDSAEERALNILGIMEPCSRINMINPVIRIYNKENRNLIEGSKIIEEISVFEPVKKSATLRKPPIQPPTDTPQKTLEIRASRTSITAGNTLLKRGTTKTPVLQKTTLKRSVKVNSSEPETSEIASLEINDSDIDKFTPLKDNEEFIFPVYIGIPVINKSKHKNEKVHVGGNYYVEVLSGRTYIAR